MICWIPLLAVLMNLKMHPHYNTLVCSKLDKSNTQKCLCHCWLDERQSFPPNPFPGIFIPGKENVHIHSAHETRKNETAIWKEQKSRWVWKGFKLFCSVFIKLVQFSFCYLKPELYGTRKELCNLNEVVQVLILPEEDVFTGTKLQFPGLSSHHFLAMKSWSQLLPLSSDTPHHSFTSDSLLLVSSEGLTCGTKIHLCSDYEESPQEAHTLLARLPTLAPSDGGTNFINVIIVRNALMNSEWLIYQER